MLVDDSETEHFINEAIINDYDEDIEILRAYDGIEALELLASKNASISLILLDINMPGMGGLEFLEHFDKLYTSPVVIMLSSSDQQKDKETAFSYGFVKDYILKPLDKTDLENASKLLETVS